jgi:hypothetical protein
MLKIPKTIGQTNVRRPLKAEDPPESIRDLYHGVTRKAKLPPQEKPRTKRIRSVI